MNSRSLMCQLRSSPNVRSRLRKQSCTTAWSVSTTPSPRMATAGTTGGTAGYGGPVAAPVFREVAMSALRMLDVPKDLPDLPLRSSAGNGI